MKTIDIIGGGIGGLTTAIALKQKGFKVRVFEQAPKLKAMGAGITLANNAMQVYKKLGLDSTLERRGHHIKSIQITDQDLVPISRTDLAPFEQKYGVRNIAIHRGLLQQTLASSLSGEELLLGKRLAKVEQTSSYGLMFTDHSKFESALVVAADGISSQVRHQLFPQSTIRQSNQYCWRGIGTFSLPAEFENKLTEAWGSGTRFGMVPINATQVYWYALQTVTDAPITVDLKDIFHKYHPLISCVIEATKPQDIHHTTIADLVPINSWVKPNLCLLGDAAHATTPNMGQGACQAIEDADVLADCLAKYPTEKALALYQNRRLKKAQKVVNMSWRIGQMAHLQNPLARALRNQVFRWIPQRFQEKQTRWLFELT